MIVLGDSHSQFAKVDLSKGSYELYIFSQIIDGFQGFPKTF